MRYPDTIPTMRTAVVNTPVSAIARLSSKYGLTGSMSALVNPYRNAQAESFMKTMKVEEVHLSGYQTFADITARRPHFIEEGYNTRRMSALTTYRQKNFIAGDGQQFECNVPS